MADAAPTLPAPRKLTRPEKAAVIVRLLVGEGVDPGLTALPEPLQERIALQMSQMQSVDRATLADVAAEFASAVDSIALAFRPGLASALGTLGKAISPAASERLRRRLSAEAESDPWERIAELSVDELLPTLEAESIEIAAVILSKLKVARAAQLLGRLPGPRARRVAYAMAETATVDQGLVLRIGRALLAQIDARPVAAFSEGPVERVGAILNHSQSATREDVLEGLDEADRVFADGVRKAIFAFPNIPDRVDARDVPKIQRSLDQALLVTALAAGMQCGQERTVEFLLANMSQRLATQLRDEMQEAGRVRDKDGEAAMTAVVASIRELETAGEVFLIVPDDD